MCIRKGATTLQRGKGKQTLVTIKGTSLLHLDTEVESCVFSMCIKCTSYHSEFHFTERQYVVHVGKLIGWVKQTKR